MNLQPTRCPQCGSMDCGPIRCRFSMIEHNDARTMPQPVQPVPAEAATELGIDANYIYLNFMRGSHE